MSETDHLKTLKELVEAGDIIDQRSWFFGNMEAFDGEEIILSGTEQDSNYVCNVQIHQIPRQGSYSEKKRMDNAIFITKAANAREALKWIVEENKRLREALEHIANTEIQDGLNYYNAVYLIRHAIQALEGKET